jgi:hypothetical protein
MASSEVVLTGDTRAKVRDPAIVVLFFALTLGIFVYPQVWYYKINRELRDFGHAKGDPELAESDPTMSVLAVTLGLLIIVPAVVSWYRCTQRIKRAQELAGTGEQLNGWIVLACAVGTLVVSLPGLAIAALVQDALNKVWKEFPEASNMSAPAAVPAMQAPEPDLGQMAPPSADQREVEDLSKLPPPSQG